MKPPKDLLKAIKKKTGINLGDLVAESPGNDPYNVGTEKDIEKGEWFADVWDQFGNQGKHLRSLHYDLVSLGDYELWNNKSYENNQKCWNKLTESARNARRLQLVDPFQFTDQRNPDAETFSEFYNYADPHWKVELNHPEFYFPSINAGVSWNYKLINLLPSISARLWEKYSEYGEKTITSEKLAKDLQPELVEVWIEKSTMDKVLKPVCEKHNANLKTFKGHSSITAPLNFIDRVRKAKRPGRILYISDHDLHGNSMPVGVARKLEFWTDRIEDIPNIKLERIALTWEQVEKYDLPHDPEGKAVELDALEALHKGTLIEIVENAISRYRKNALSQKIKKQKSEINGDINELEREIKDKFGKEAKEIKSEVEDLTDEYQEKIDDIIGNLESEFESDLEPLKERLSDLKRKVDDYIEKNDIETPEPPERAKVEDNGNVLFDSERDYLEQFERYQKYENSNSN